MLNIHKIRIVLWGGLLAVLVFLGWQAVVPTGRVTYEKVFPKDNFFIKDLTPKERVDKGGSGLVRITGDPVYFNLYTPRTFNRAELEMVYRRVGKAARQPESLPVIQVGILADPDAWRYRLQPMENYWLDRLAGQWQALKQDGKTLWQKRGRYKNVQEFLQQPPASERIAVFRADLPFEYKPGDYQQATGTRRLPASLQGQYEMYTYIQDEDLDLDFTFTDLNQNRDADPVEVRLLYNKQVISRRKLADDGVTEATGQTSEPASLKFIESGLPDGVYRIAVRTNNDIVTRDIAHNRSRLAFRGSVRLYDADTKDISLFTDSPRVHIKTLHPGARQKIRFADREVRLDQTYKQYDVAVGAVTSPPYRLDLEQDGVTVAGSGVFAFRAKELINPGFTNVDRDFARQKGEVDYIYTSYEPQPRISGKWQTATLGLDLAAAYRENNKYNLLLAVPGLKAEDGANDGIEVRSIKVRLQGKDLITKIREWNLWPF